MSPTAGCDDVAAEVRTAEALLLAMDLDGAAASLQRAEVALGCRVVGPTEIATLFLVDGALAEFRGDHARAQHLFGAAGRVAPEVWLVDLGEALLQQYREARASGAPSGALRLEGDARGLRVDGKPGAPPVGGGGPRVLQLVDGDVVRFGARVEVVGDTVVTLPATSPEAPRPAARGGLAPHVGVGGELVAGHAAARAGTAQAGIRASVPLEVGALVRAGPLFVRPTVGVGWSSTPLLFLADGEVRDTRLLVAAGLAAGWDGPVRPGVRAGARLPGRQALEGVLGLPLGGPWSLEARAGAHLVQGDTPEAAAALWLLGAPDPR